MPKVRGKDAHCVTNIKDQFGGDYPRSDDDGGEVCIPRTQLVKAKSGAVLKPDSDGNIEIEIAPIFRDKNAVEIPIIVEQGVCYVNLPGINSDGPPKITNECTGEVFEQDENCDYSLPFTANCYDQSNSIRNIAQALVLTAIGDTAESETSPVLEVCNNGKMEVVAVCDFTFRQTLQSPLDPGTFSAVFWKPDIQKDGQSLQNLFAPGFGGAQPWFNTDTSEAQVRFNLQPGECCELTFNATYEHVNGDGTINIGTLGALITCTRTGAAPCQDLGPIQEG